MMIENRTFSEAELHTTEKTFMYLLLFKLSYFLNSMTRLESLFYICREDVVGEDNSDEGSGSQSKFGGTDGVGQGGSSGKCTVHT